MSEPFNVEYELWPKKPRNTDLVDLTAILQFHISLLMSNRTYNKLMIALSFTKNALGTVSANIIKRFQCELYHHHPINSDGLQSLQTTKWS